MTISLRGMEEMTKCTPLGVKAREEGPTSSQGPASVGPKTSSGALWTASMSPQHKAALPCAFGEGIQGQCPGLGLTVVQC